MLTMKDLLDEIDRLPTAEKWQIVEYALRSLKHEQLIAPASDWHEFLRSTYGILKDTPIERPPQLPLENREPME